MPICSTDKTPPIWSAKAHSWNFEKESEIVVLISRWRFVWNSCLHLPENIMVHVGKYSTHGGFGMY